MTDLRSLLFNDNIEIVTKETEREKTIDKYKNEKVGYNYICTQCQFKCNSYIREIEHIQNTRHKMKDVKGLWSF